MDLFFKPIGKIIYSRYILQYYIYNYVQINPESPPPLYREKVQSDMAFCLVLLLCH